MRRGQREPFELIEVVETFDFGGAGEAAGDSAELPLPGLVPGGFVASERVRIAVLALVAIRFGAIAPGISSAFNPFASFTSMWLRVLIATPSLAATGYLATAVLVLVRPAAQWWYSALVIAAADVALSGVWSTWSLWRNDPSFKLYTILNLVFVLPSLVVLVLGAVAWRRGMRPVVASADSVRVLIDG